MIGGRDGAGGRGEARIWEVSQGAAIGRVMPHDGEVTAVRFSRDGSLLATGSIDRTARVWDARTGAPVAAPLLHRFRVYDVAFSPDGNRLATASGDAITRPRHLSDGQAVEMIGMGGTLAVWNLSPTASVQSVEQYVQELSGRRLGWTNLTLENFSKAP